MERNRKLWWLALSLVILGMALFSFDIHSAHIGRSGSVVAAAGILLVAGMGVDLWRRTSRGARAPLVQPPKHPVLLNVLFFATLLVLGSAQVYLMFFAPESNWRQNLRTVTFCLLGLVAYNLLVALVGYLRIRHNPSNN